MDLFSKYNKSIGIDWDEAEEYKYYQYRTVITEVDKKNSRMQGRFDQVNEYVMCRVIKKDNIWSIKEPTGDLIEGIQSFEGSVIVQVTIERAEKALIIKGVGKVVNDYVNIIDAKVTPTTIIDNNTWTNADSWKVIESDNSSGIKWGGSGTSTAVYLDGVRLGNVQSLDFSTTDQGNVYSTGGNGYSSFRGGSVSGTFTMTTADVTRLMEEIEPERYPRDTKPGVSGGGLPFIDQAAILLGDDEEQ